MPIARAPSPISKKFAPRVPTREFVVVVPGTSGVPIPGPAPWARLSTAPSAIAAARLKVIKRRFIGSPRSANHDELAHVLADLPVLGVLARDHEQVESARHQVALARAEVPEQVAGLVQVRLGPRDLLHELAGDVVDAQRPARWHVRE